MVTQIQQPTIIPQFIKNAFLNCYPNPQYVLNIYHQLLTGRYIFHFYDRDESIKETTLDAQGNWLKTVTELEDFQLEERIIYYLHQRFKSFDIVELFQTDTPDEVYVSVVMRTKGYTYDLQFNENGFLLEEEKEVIDDSLADKHTVFDFENCGNNFRQYN